MPVVFHFNPLINNSQLKRFKILPVRGAYFNPLINNSQLKRFAEMENKRRL